MFEVHDVVVDFGGVRALDELSVVCHESGFCGLIGPNGAGKTTLFDVITGLRRPTAGQVWYGDRDVTQHSVMWRARRGMRRTFQRTQLVGEMSVADNVLVGLDAASGGFGLAGDLVGLRSRRRTERQNRARVEDTLAMCGIAQLGSMQAALLPIGLTRIVELARALVAEPKLLLLDEPTSGLNDAETAEFADILRSVHRERDLQVLLVEHDVAFVMQLCQRVLVMDQGRIIADGLPAAVQADEVVQQTYLG